MEEILLKMASQIKNIENDLNDLKTKLDYIDRMDKIAYDDNLFFSINFTLFLSFLLDPKSLSNILENIIGNYIPNISELGQIILRFALPFLFLSSLFRYMAPFFSDKLSKFVRYVSFLLLCISIIFVFSIISLAYLLECIKIGVYGPTVSLFILSIIISLFLYPEKKLERYYISIQSMEKFPIHISAIAATAWAELSIQTLIDALSSITNRPFPILLRLSYYCIFGCMFYFIIEELVPGDT